MATAADVGFYQRRTDGFGKFIDRATIEARDPFKMTDLFKGIAGVSFVSISPLEQAVVLRGARSGLGSCFPKVVLDGLVIERLADYPALIDRLIDPESVAGVEIFPSSAGVPAQYAGIDVTCGVILFWTRR